MGPKSLRDQAIITVPDDIGVLDTNAPWIVRPGGRNFWEEIQYRDPRPDHVHAVIPGHRFDAIMKDRVDHPIRGRIDSGAATRVRLLKNSGYRAASAIPRIPPTDSPT